MKNLLFFFALVLLAHLPFNAKAQWSMSGANTYNSNTGNVGVGISSPTSKLHVNGGILSTGMSGSTPLITPGSCLMWIPSKYAFRAGFVTDNQWSDANIGTGSLSAGYNTVASGLMSTAFGILSSASGDGAIALSRGSASGSGSLAANGGIAQGTNSIALGMGSIASVDNSVALGVSNTASGVQSIAFGGGHSVASGLYSIAIGEHVKASNSGSITIGRGYGELALDNSIGNSLMVGFNSFMGPALFVGPGSLESPGYVGIGTSNPQSALAVNGEITARALTLTKDGWPDYVFASGYKLRSLEETEQFINEHKHLPDVPSEKEILEKGLNVGDMSEIMIKKIEELTLHMIELKKQNDLLEKKSNALQVQNDLLKKLINEIKK